MANNPTLMSMPICRDAEKNTIPVTDNGTTGKFSEQYGWQGINSLPLSAGGKAVDRLDFNGVLGLLGGIAYMTQRGYTFEWDNTLPYVVGCIVIDTTDGKTYRCVKDVPAGSTAPSLDSTNWVVYDIADYVGGALRLTSYSVGDTSTLVGIPAGYYLECTTAGITAATAPVITPPVTAGQTITDGTVVWTVRKCFPTSGGVLDGIEIKKRDNKSQMTLFGGSDASDGGFLTMIGTQNPSVPNITDIIARMAVPHMLGTGYMYLGISKDGKLWWGNSGVFQRNLDDMAIVSQSINNNGYIIWSNGLAIAWYVTGGTAPITFNNYFVGTDAYGNKLLIGKYSL